MSKKLQISHTMGIRKLQTANRKIGNWKSRIACFTFLMTLFIFTGNAQSLQGSWVVNKVTIEKIVNDVKESTMVYNNVSEIRSRYDCPRKWEINKESIVLYPYRGPVQTATYKQQDNKIILNRITHTQTYEYKLSKNTLTLTTTYKTAHTQPRKPGRPGRPGTPAKTEQTEERWTIELRIEN